ncbi:MAG: imelysin family protein [Chryseolinea sp.]
MKATYIKFLLTSVAVLVFTACDDNNEGGSAVNTTLNSDIINDFSNNLPVVVYGELFTKTSLLYDQVGALNDGATDAELAAARTTWKEARKAWEHSEAFLFGPVSTKSIDPRIDTWPVNFTDLDAQLASTNAFSADYIDGLDDALKGFHPIEYLIFGKDGNKAAADLTPRQKEYLTALALNLKTLTEDLKSFWDKSVTTSYYHDFTNAGAGSTVYETQKSAFEEMVNAMMGICDEVGNGKIMEPYEAKDPELEESPFSQNSFVDFKNNITGVQDVYLGKYTTDGKGLEDLVKAYNLQLDNEIKAKLSAAINSFDAFTVPFGQAITTESVKIQNTIDACNALHNTLEQSLLPFVQQHSK